MGPRDKKVPAIESPAGVDLGGVTGKVVRISGRTRYALFGLGVLLLAGFAYGGYKKSHKVETDTRPAGAPLTIAPATMAGEEILKKSQAPAVPVSRWNPGQLEAPGTLEPGSAGRGTIPPPLVPCERDPRTGQPFRFNPSTGQPCDAMLPPVPTLPQERVVVMRPPSASSSPAQPGPAAVREQTEQEQLRAALSAPTGIRSGSRASAMLPDPAALAAALPAFPSAARRSNFTTTEANSSSDYELQNAQNGKEDFLQRVRQRQSSGYLGATREAPLSRYEIKAGWEIPAMLEQSLNSDLPGELKALVSSHVYDTATGMYLLIPQGSRMIGKYDSRVSYGQDAVQVAWNRIIYPDASSVDLDGMAGLDARGNAGLHDKVDRHYSRLIGFSALTSLFTGAFAISQRNNQSALVNPTPGQAASGAVGQELSQTGSQLTRRNLNVQPTLKIPAGYKFVVRVNKDILFEEPYRPEPAGPPALPPRKGFATLAGN